MRRYVFVSSLVVACGSPPAPVEPEKPPAPVDPTADCAAIAEIFTTFKHPTADTPSEGDLLKYYGNVAKAFREVKLEVTDLRAAAKDASDLFTALGGRSDAIAKAYVALDAAVTTKNKRLNDVYDAMRAIWNLREFCESAECKRLFEVEKTHHAVVRMRTSDAAAFKSAIAAFRSEITSVPAVDQSVGFARKNMDGALAAYEEASLKLADAQVALDDAVRASESKMLRGRFLGYCPDLGEKR